MVIVILINKKIILPMRFRISIAAFEKHMIILINRNSNGLRLLCNHPIHVHHVTKLNQNELAWVSYLNFLMVNFDEIFYINRSLHD